MAIVNQVSDQMKDAMKAKEKSRLAALRSMRSLLLNEMKKDNSTDLSDEVAVGLFRRLEKQRLESIDAFEAAGRTDPVASPALEPTSLPAPLQTQKVHWVGSITETPIYDRDKLGKGATLAGPAILTQLDTTTLIAPGWTACVHSSGALILTKDVA